MTDSMRDFPNVLKLNITAAQLAPAIYYARCLLYDVGAPIWDGASPEIHRCYIDCAQHVLRALAPPTASASVPIFPRLVTP